MSAIKISPKIICAFAANFEFADRLYNAMMLCYCQTHLHAAIAFGSGPVEIAEEMRGVNPSRAPSFVVVHYLDDVPCRAAAKKSAACRTCLKVEWKHEADMNGVWGPWPQENLR